jgi:hypothetical protein
MSMSSPPEILLLVEDNDDDETLTPMALETNHQLVERVASAALDCGKQALG